MLVKRVTYIESIIVTSLKPKKSERGGRIGERRPTRQPPEISNTGGGIYWGEDK